MEIKVSATERAKIKIRKTTRNPPHSPHPTPCRLGQFRRAGRKVAGNSNDVSPQSSKGTINAAESNWGFMYEVTVEDTFAAGHYLRNYKGKCENPHGHNY